MIAEFQCDVRFIGQKEAKALVLPLRNTGQIKQGNALRLDWSVECPLHLHSDGTSNAEVEFMSDNIETYLCGNPPYKGTKAQSAQQKSDLAEVYSTYSGKFKVLDYVSGWFVKASEYLAKTNGKAAFVSTNSVCQGNQVPVLWPLVYSLGLEISFAYTSFKWSNLATNSAGVTVIVVGLENSPKIKTLYSSENGKVVSSNVKNINAYLVPCADIIVQKRASPFQGLSKMVLGNQPYEGGHLIMTPQELQQSPLSQIEKGRFVRGFLGLSLIHI